MSIETQLEALAGSEIPSGVSEGIALGTGLAHGYDFYESTLGTVAVTFNPEGVTSLDIAEGFEARFEDRFGKRLIRAEAPDAWRRHIPEAIERGRPGKLPVDLRSVTDFQQHVLRTTATIPKGEVRPYGWVAREVHRPQAVRAVGSAVARNPVPLIIPCHRVVRSDGRIGNYSLGGPQNKVSLLEREGAGPGRLEDLARRHIRVQANLGTGVFCLPTCHVIRNAPRADILDFHSSSEAIAAGHHPCVECRPAA